MPGTPASRKYCRSPLAATASGGTRARRSLRFLQPPPPPRGRRLGRAGGAWEGGIETEECRMGPTGCGSPGLKPGLGQKSETRKGDARCGRVLQDASSWPNLGFSPGLPSTRSGFRGGGRRLRGIHARERAPMPPLVQRRKAAASPLPATEILDPSPECGVGPTPTHHGSHHGWTCTASPESDTTIRARSPIPSPLRLVPKRSTRRRTIPCPLVRSATSVTALHRQPKFGGDYQLLGLPTE